MFAMDTLYELRFGASVSPKCRQRTGSAYLAVRND